MLAGLPLIGICIWIGLVNILNAETLSFSEKTTNSSLAHNAFSLESSSISSSFSLFQEFNQTQYEAISKQDNVFASEITPLNKWNNINISGIPPRSYHSSVIDAKENKIYIFGGYNTTNGYLNDFYCYDIKTGGVTQLNASGITPRGFHSMVLDTDRKKIYIFGGYSDGNYLNDCWVFDISTSKWYSINVSGITPRAGHCAVYDPITKKMYIYGGRNSLTTFNDMWSYNPQTGEWIQVQTSGISGRYGHSMCIDEEKGKIYILFGSYYSKSFGNILKNDMWCFSIQTQTWENIPVKGITPRMYHSACWDNVNRKMYVFGGKDDVQLYGDCWSYSPDTQTWNSVPVSGPVERYSATLVYGNYLVYLFGGTDHEIIGDMWSYAGSYFSQNLFEFSISSISSNTYGILRVIGYGSGANGDGITIKLWNVSTSSLETVLSTQEKVISITINSISNYIDSSNKFRALIHTNYPSNNLYSSSLYIDYIELELITPDIIPPEPPSELEAIQLDQSKIYLTWLPSPSEDVEKYNIYFDNGTGVIDYSNPIASVYHPQTSWTSESLIDGVIYTFGVRAVDKAGNEEKNTDVIVSVKAVSTTPPSPVTYFIATPLDQTSIQLEWGLSPSSDAAVYHIYFDNATGNIDYTTPIASIPHPNNSCVIVSLTPNTTYRFGIRTVDNFGTEEQNTDIVASATTLPIQEELTITAKIIVPHAGMKIRGNVVPVFAEIFNNQSKVKGKERKENEIREVRFEYKPIESKEWLIMQTLPNEINHKNPDTEFPYFIHWYVKDLPNAKYDIRAVVVMKSGKEDKNASSIMVVIDKHRGKLIENEQIEKEKIIEIKNNKMNVKVKIPYDFPKEINVIDTPLDLPSIPQNKKCLASFKISLGNEQIMFNKPLSIIIKYIGFEDISKIKVYQHINGNWKEIPVITNNEERTITINVTMPGYVSLLEAEFSPDSEKEIIVYPNPFKPSNGHKEITFKNLPQNTSIKIYTISGDLVYSQENVTGTATWKAVNQNGENVASGIYLYLLTTPSGEKKIGKIGVIR
jgi:N-acetylneuraminic acid mutarotase